MMEFKSVFKHVEFSTDGIKIKTLFKRLQVSFGEVQNLTFYAPKYIGIPGSGYIYLYQMKIRLKNKSACIEVNFPVEQEKDFQELKHLIEQTNINFVVKRYDNRDIGD